MEGCDMAKACEPILPKGGLNNLGHVQGALKGA